MSKKIIAALLFNFMATPMHMLPVVFVAPILFSAALFSVALAQEQKLDEILVVGVDDTLQGLVKASIDASVGDATSGLNLETIKTQIAQLGYFKTVAAEIKTTAGKNQLVITLASNPSIGEIEIKGNKSVATAQLTNFLEQQFNIAPGVIQNNARLEEARAGIAQAYRQGLPFSPEVKLDVVPAEGDKVKVLISIAENAKVKKVVVEGATLVPAKEIEDAFKPMTDKGEFDAEIYGQLLRDISTRYERDGYRGSGANPASSELSDGTLTIVIREYKIASIDTSALGVAPDKLSLKTGDAFNYKKLLDDVRGLNKNRDKQVSFSVEQITEDTVAVTLTLEDAPAGPIKEIKIEGNTVVSASVLQKAIKQKLGDTYNAVSAKEQDFPEVLAAYQKAGYLIDQQPRLSYSDGVYSIKILEQKIIDYDLRWQGTPPVADRIIVRELPKPGLLFNINNLVSGLRALRNTGLVTNIRPNVRVPNPEKPEEVILVLDLESPARFFEIEPGVSYNSLSGASGGASFKLNNLFALNHKANVSLNFNPNDAGQWFNGNASYSIPWLDFDFLDFQQTRTTFSVGVSTSVDASQILKDSVDPAGVGVERRTSQRNTAFGLSFNRPIISNLDASLSFSVNWANSFLETKKLDTNKNYFLNDAQAYALASYPKDSLTAFIGLSGNYNTRNSAEFPTSGVLVSLSTGYGWGSESTTPLSWTRTVLGGSTYFGFGLDKEGEFGIGENRNMAVATRFSVGTIFGAAPSNSKFQIGGGPQVDDFVLRGFTDRSFTGDVFYTGSLEYRYDFQFATPVTQNILGIAFVDFGNAWGANNAAPGIQFGYGLGLQINVAIGPLQIPGIRFDYGFSAQNPGGVFHFRLKLPF